MDHATDPDLDAMTDDELRVWAYLHEVDNSGDRYEMLVAITRARRAGTGLLPPPEDLDL